MLLQYNLESSFSAESIEQQHNYTDVIFISKGSRILRISYKTRRAWYHEIINVSTDCALPGSQSTLDLFRHTGGEDLKKTHPVAQRICKSLVSRITSATL